MCDEKADNRDDTGIILAILFWYTSITGFNETGDYAPTLSEIKSYPQLDIKKIQVRVNETVPIGVTVQNQGQTGNSTILIEINGEPAGEKNLSLRYLQTETVYFNITEKKYRDVQGYNPRYTTCKAILRYRRN